MISIICYMIKLWNHDWISYKGKVEAIVYSRLKIKKKSTVKKISQLWRIQTMQIWRERTGEQKQYKWNGWISKWQKMIHITKTKFKKFTDYVFFAFLNQDLPTNSLKYFTVLFTNSKYILTIRKWLNARVGLLIRNQYIYIYIHKSRNFILESMKLYHMTHFLKFSLFSFLLQRNLHLY